MDNIKPLFLFFLISLIFWSCRSKENLDNFDKKLWTSDYMGCKNIRATLKENVLKQKNKLKGLSELEVMDVLGRPDKAELGDRNRKYFYYYLNSGSQCGTEKTEEGAYLQIGFNAVRLSNAVIVVM